jgi:two-component system cell cycle sensor histidine kinase/response regulator CckA
MNQWRARIAEVWVRRWKPRWPTTASGELTLTAQRAQLLNTLLWTLIIVTAPLAAYDTWQWRALPQQNLAAYAIADLFSIGGLVLLLRLNRQGRTRLSALLVVAAVTGLITFTFPAEAMPHLLIAYAVPTVLASFVLAPVASLPVMLVSVACYLTISHKAGGDSTYDYVNTAVLTLLALLAWRAAAYLEEAIKINRDRAARYRALFDQGYEAVFIDDVHNHTIDVNQRACELLGYTRAELLTMTVADRQAPAMRGTSTNVIQEDIARFRGASFESLDLRRDGEIIPVEVSITPIDLNDGQTIFQSIVRDVSQQKAAAAALRASEERFRRLFEEASLGIFQSTFDGKLIEVNPAYAQMFGFASPAEAQARMSDVANDVYVYPERRREFVAAALASQEPLSFENEYRRPDGTVFLGALHLRTVRDAGGQPLYLEGYVEDVTERKQRDALLLQTQKLESIGLLAGGIAHDFNNLLTGMLGQASLATALLPADHPARSHVQKTVNSAERAAELTRQLLAYAGKGQMRAELVDINELLHANHDLLETVIPKHVHLEMALAGEQLLVTVDRSQMQQVVMNLVINGAEAVEGPAGTVTVRTERRLVHEDADAADFVTGVAPRPGEYVCLQVTDDGAGMAPITLARIFDPFFSTKATGRGLGLAAMMGIVRAHHGGLQVASRPGLGTVFTVWLPAERRAAPLIEAATAPASPVLATPPLPPAQEVSVGSPVVLVIDDELPVCEALCDILDMAGFAVTATHNGREGLAMFRRLGAANVRLVLLDLLMPVMGGEETLRALRELDPTVPVLLSSGYDEEEAVSRLGGLLAAGPGAGDARLGFLQKPYDLDAVIARVREMAR